MQTTSEYLTLLLTLMLLPSECLLNKGSGSDAYTDKVVEELQRNVTMLLEKVASLDQVMTIKEQEYNRTTGYQQQLIYELQTDNANLQGNLTELQKKMEARESQQNHTIVCPKICSKIEEKINQSFSAYQLILQDVVDKQNRQIPVQNSTQTLSQNFADLTKQFHYVSLSVLDIEKKVTNEQRKIYDLDKQVSEHNQTISDQQPKIQTLQEQVKHLELNVSDQQNFNQHVLGIEGKVNDSFSAYQVILHDLVDRYNQQSALNDNRTHDLNKSIADQGKQFHYLSLSLLDSQNKLAQFNSSFSG